MASGREAGPTGAPGESLRVMVLDDEPIVGKRLAPGPEQARHRGRGLRGSRTAPLARLGEAHFDVVVTDLRMEEINGIQVLEYVTSHCKTPGSSSSPATRPWRLPARRWSRGRSTSSPSPSSRGTCGR